MQPANHLDKIRIEDIKIPCIIGIAPKERIKPQQITINLTLYADITAACRSDDIADTVNYKVIKNRIRDFVPATSYYLIEKMADQVARICFDDPRVVELCVKVEKPGALTLARSVSVELYRKRQDYEL